MTNCPPQLNSPSFDCPWCTAYAHQKWTAIVSSGQGLFGGSRGPSYEYVENYNFSQCASCFLYAVWIDGNLVHPLQSLAPMASSDMPKDVADIYNEARAVSAVSPRAAVALLRLALQTLCKHLGQPGKHINNDIAALVKANAISEKVQKAMDLIRVVGNNAVHPGLIDFADDAGVSTKMFIVLNVIVDSAITQPKKIEELFDEHVPDNLKSAIDKRDKK